MFPHEINGSEYDVHHSQRDKYFPANTHQLVVTEPGDGPANPHEEEYEEEHFCKEDHGS